MVDSTRCSSIKCTYSLGGATPGDNIGPVIVGVAHSDYTSAEIEAYLEAASSWDIGDKIVKEVRSRLVRVIGVFDIPEGVGQAVRLNDGRAIRTKLNWLLAEGDTLGFWAYNSGPAAYATTDPNLIVQGKANLWQV